MHRLKQTVNSITYQTFYEICRWAIVCKSLFIGLSLFFFSNNYSSPTFNYIFQSVSHTVWAVIFTCVGVTMLIGTLQNSFLYRVSAAVSGGILGVWALGFPLSGAFRRSPPSFFIWASAALLDVMVAITIQPKVIDSFLHEMERLPKPIEG